MGVSERSSHGGKMKKKVFFTLTILTCGLCMRSAPLLAIPDDSLSAEDKAKEVHRLASSDMIYGQEELKALYYQNTQIIDLLREIRDLLAKRLEETKDK